MSGVDLLSAGGWLFSIGDIATARCSARALAERGVCVCPVDEPRAGRTTVIGGGHILGHQPHLTHYLLPGRHALNAVGGHRTGDFSYLREYAYVSVRDRVSAEIVGVGCEIVPCPSILTEPTAIASRTVLPRQGHVVVHRDPIVEESLRRRSVSMLVVDPQPERANPWRRGGEELRATHCPEILVAAIAGAHAVITRSLHLGIFALCAGVPFCCLDTGDEPQSNKMRDYWRRAGMEGVMYDGDDPIRHAVSLRYDWNSLRTAERARVHEHFDDLVAALQTHSKG